MCAFCAASSTVGHALGAMRERVEEEALRTLPAFRLCRFLTRLARFLAGLGGELVAGVDGGAVAAFRDLGDGGERCSVRLYPAVVGSSRRPFSRS
jgi:hypothetical protein